MVGDVGPVGHAIKARVSSSNGIRVVKRFMLYLLEPVMKLKRMLGAAA